MLWCPFFARVKDNYRCIYSHILTRVCAVAMAMGLVKNKAEVYFKKIQSLDCFHLLHTMNWQ